MRRAYPKGCDMSYHPDMAIYAYDMLAYLGRKLHISQICEHIIGINGLYDISRPLGYALRISGRYVFSAGEGVGRPRLHAMGTFMKGGFGWGA